MNGEGNKLMAIGVLQAFGLYEAQIQKAKASWAPLEAKAADEAAKKAAATAARRSSW